MTSYKKLKHKCLYLQSQVDLFINALTITRKQETKYFNNSAYGFIERMAIQRNKIIDERVKEQLQRWVVENLDAETVMYYLHLKEKLKND